MNSRCLLVVGLLCFIPRLFCLNVLLVSIGYAGHVIPLFELAKALKHHNITFITQQLAQAYVDFKHFPDPSLFRVIYTDDSPDAFLTEKQQEQELIAYSANHSFFDSLGQTTRSAGNGTTSPLHKTVHVLMHNRFDVIIANSLVKGIHVLSQQTNTPCVTQTTESFSDMFNFNLPNVFSMLSTKQMTDIRYRIYNVVYSLRLMTIFMTKVLPSISKIGESLPRIPGPFYDSFSMKNLFLTQSKCLEIVSLPPTFHPPTYPHHSTKYLGAFIDESAVEYANNELTRWIQSKADHSIIYGAFGTSSLIRADRMKNLLNGLAEFLSKTPDSFLLLILRHGNYETYRAVVAEMNNDRHRSIFENSERVRIENGFAPQKWILQQSSIKLFLSHCGMGSCSEGIYFQKPILCLPFNMDQFINGNAIENLGVGLSLFVPPSLFQSLLQPYHFYNYTFPSDSVRMKLAKIWENESYQKMARIMSLEMKHAGGVKQAVKEIEYLVEIDGDLDRYAPFQSTLPFYQRYMLDLLVVFVIVPLAVLMFTVRKCCRRHRKQKKD